MMEAQLILSTVAQRYQLRLIPGHPVEPQMVVTLRPRYGLPMTIHATERAGNQQGCSCRQEKPSMRRPTRKGSGTSLTGIGQRVTPVSRRDGKRLSWRTN